MPPAPSLARPSRPRDARTCGYTTGTTLRPNGHINTQPRAIAKHLGFGLDAGFRLNHAVCVSSPDKTACQTMRSSFSGSARLISRSFMHVWSERARCGYTAIKVELAQRRLGTPGGH